ncbi:MAG: hypothetical protein MZU79_07575 [Anaerotruncus sp.]|nr:hypothetical protein [Anaerotruncus sp.]
MFLFALQFPALRRRASERDRTAALWIIPVATIALAATNERHQPHLVGLPVGRRAQDQLLIYDARHLLLGPRRLLLRSSSSATTVFLLLAFFRFKGIHRRQAADPAAGLPPALGRQRPLPGRAGGRGAGLRFHARSASPSPGFFLLWAMFRLQLVDILPVARERVIDSMGESLVILDENGPAGRHQSGRPPAHRRGRRAGRGRARGEDPGPARRRALLRPGPT